jgi:hypothetical protein
VTDIPEDIREKAKAAFFEMHPLAGADENIAALARALLAERMAERERCAKVAETADEDDDRLDQQVRQNVAAAIRGQKP